MSALNPVRRRVARWKSRGTVRIDRSARIGHGAVIEVDRGGQLEIAADARIGARARILVRSGRVTIGEGAELLERASVVALEEVAIGANALLGEMSVVMDFAPPSLAPAEVPLRVSGVATAPVSIGPGAAVGAKAVVGAGAQVPEGGRVAPGGTIEAGGWPGP